MGLSDFRKKKVVRAFDAFDLTDDGELSVEDIEERIKNLASKFKIEEGSDKYERLVKAEMKIWNEYLKAADENGDKVIEKDEWMSAHEKLLHPDEKENYLALCKETCEALWEFIDADGNGTLDLDEFKLYMTSYVKVGSDEGWIEKLFNAIDSSGKGSITKDEYVAATVDWAFSDDENAAGNGLYGPY